MANNKINNEITNLDALALSKAIKSKKYSCVEVMETYLDKIDELNPKVNAIVSLRQRDELVVEAKEKDNLLAKGEYQGWMHGFPHAVKDLSSTKGIPSTMAFPGLKNYIPAQDSVMVERLRRDGAIIIGKTNTPEFGLGSNTYNNVFGTTYNAYDQSKTSGGSSGGAAVALALKMVPVADGSDMMGSLRNPTAFNNVFGFRPSQGRVPFGPMPELFISQLGYEGPMGRTVKDTAQLLMTQSGYDSRTPMTLTNRLPNEFVATDKPEKSLKIGWLGNLGDLPMEKGILELCERSLKTFESLGCHVEPTKLNVSSDFIWQTWLTCRHFYVSNGLRPLYNNPDMRKLLKPEAIWEVEGGLNMNGEQFFKGCVDRSAIYNAFAELFKQYDFVIMPSAQVFPFDASLHSPQEIEGKKMDTYHRYMEIVISVTLAGLPSLNIPVGFGQNGLPMGMQLIGPYTQDFDVLKLGHAYEQACGWTSHLPPLLK